MLPYKPWGRRDWGWGARAFRPFWERKRRIAQDRQVWFACGFRAVALRKEDVLHIPCFTCTKGWPVGVCVWLGGRSSGKATMDGKVRKHFHCLRFSFEALDGGKWDDGAGKGKTASTSTVFCYRGGGGGELLAEPTTRFSRKTLAKPNLPLLSREAMADGSHDRVRMELKLVTSYQHHPAQSWCAGALLLHQASISNCASFHRTLTFEGTVVCKCNWCNDGCNIVIWL